MPQILQKPGPALSDSVAEICAAFPSKAAMQEAMSELTMAGFDRADLSLPHPDGENASLPEAGADNPLTPTDQRQMRTMGSSMAGAAAAIAAAGVTVATGGAAAVVVGAAVAAGAGAGLLTNAAISPSEGTTGAGERPTAEQKLLLTVRTGSVERDVRARAILQRAGATEITQDSRSSALQQPI